MRKTLATVTLATLTMVAAGCSSSAPSGAPGPRQNLPNNTAPPRPAASAQAVPAASAPAIGQPNGPAATAPTLVQPNATGASRYDGVTFENPSVNPYIDPRQDRTSTFGLDVDTASYTLARRFVDDGHLPDPNSVRVEEFVNYFDQGYPPLEEGTFGINVDGSPTPFLPSDETLVRIGIQSAHISSKSRPPASLTFVIDVSGSMARDGRLELVKDALRLLVRQLRPSDSVAVVAFSTQARVVLPPTRATDDETIMAAIDQLEPENTTNVGAGLTLGYELARESLAEGGINRVVLASDGVANVGLTDPDLILRRISDDAQAGIQLVSVGVGMGNYNDALLERLADQGDGFYAYVDTLDEAQRLFVQDLTGTLDTVALEARVQVDFNPDTVDAYRLIGYENRAIPDQSFRSDDVKAGAIGAGHSVTALYAVRPKGEIAANARLATVLLRWVDPVTQQASEIAQDFHPSDLALSFRSANPYVRLDALVAATAETLRGSPWIEQQNLSELQRMSGQYAEVLPQSNQTTEFLDLLDRLARLEAAGE